MVYLLGCVTALGGGTARDILFDNRPLSGLRVGRGPMAERLQDAHRDAGG